MLPDPPAPAPTLADLLILIGDREVTIARLRQQLQQQQAAVQGLTATVQKLRAELDALAHADSPPHAAL